MKLYDALGVAIDATRSEIKKSYLKLAKKFHPDKGGDVESFKEIQKAYDVLGNKDKREHYDRTGDSDNRKEDPMKILMSIFALIIETGDFTGNIVSKVTKKIESEIDTLKGNLKKLDVKMIKLENQKGRISTKGDNLFEMMISNKIEEIKRLKQLAENKIEEMIEIILQLDKYQDNNPESNKQPDPFFDVLSGHGFNQGSGRNPFA